ncbi:MAG: gliding motility lipoprotein GldD [Bacteroidetes bacterium]|nr:gliding motility lipoprotein GldD [Bacteroidota bacterium]
MKILSLVLISLFLAGAFSCSGDNNFIPKPPTYLKLDLPTPKYISFSDSCPYTFEIPSFYSLKTVLAGECHKDIDLGPLNGVIHFSYIPMVEPLSAYVNYSIDKVDEHKIKATAINDTRFIDTAHHVFGTLFELKGDVASPFQFYLTDSTKNFVSGVVYFNSQPNYDSLKPSLDYLKKDLLHMIETFRWKKQQP